MQNSNLPIMLYIVWELAQILCSMSAVLLPDAGFLKRVLCTCRGHAPGVQVRMIESEVPSVATCEALALLSCFPWEAEHAPVTWAQGFASYMLKRIQLTEFQRNSYLFRCLLSLSTNILRTPLSLFLLEQHKEQVERFFYFFSPFFTKNKEK